MAVFSKPDVVSAYVERLDTTTLPFAIDAAHILELVPPNPGSEYVVLDDACGTGAAVEWIVRAFAKADVPLKITATDQSAVMMNEVEKRRHRNSWSDEVRFVMMDAQALNFPNNTFTHVFMNFGIMLVPEYKRALKSIFRVLRRDGQVAITSWKSQGHWHYLTRAARKILEDPNYPPPRFFDEKWLSGDFIEKLLLQIGFRNVKVHERTHLWKWSSKDAFIRFVGKNRAPSIQMYMAGWTPQQKEDVAICIKDILDNEFPGTEMFHVPMVANIVVGCKP